ncbi:MAG: NAD(P)-dependent oxidoreductase [Mycobacteriales bacterium]
MTSHVVVVGAAGFIGRATCRALVTGVSDLGVLAVVRTPTHIPDVAVHVLGKSVDVDSRAITDADVVIWTAGGADHGLGDRDPMANLNANTLPVLELLQGFRGHLVLMSSQSVYSGLTGPGIDEFVDHVPNMAYGFSKLAAERHAMWSQQRGELRSVWIHRLMYAFGPGEPPRRLIRRLVSAGAAREEMRVNGGGRSFLNPLPVEFVGEVLARSARDLIDGHVHGTLVTNICHPDAMTVRDVVSHIADITGGAVGFDDGNEPWPVHFQGSPARLARHLSRWGLQFPEPREHLTQYVLDLQKELLQ